MTIQVVADTHAVIWYLYDDPRLSLPARTLMDAVDAEGNQIAIASITLAEIIYLIERGRVPPTVFDDLLMLLDEIDTTLVVVPFDRAIANVMRRIERIHVPELPDRITAATAVHLGTPIVSRDLKLRHSSVVTIW